MREPLPLATIHDAVLAFLRGRTDAVLFGAQAVNAYVDESRMTQDVDLLSLRALDLAGEIREFLQNRFHVAIRVREVADGKGFRVYQAAMPKNRQLVDVRAVAVLPPFNAIDNVLVAAPAELIAQKVIAAFGRKGQPKSFTDQRDLAILLLRFPELKSHTGPVHDRLIVSAASAGAMALWADLAGGPDVPPADEADEFR